MQCVGEFPLLAGLIEEHGPERVAVLGISIDSDCGKAREIVLDRAVSWPQVCDGEGMAGAAARTFNVKGVPSYYVLDGHGRIVAKRVRAERLAEIVAGVLEPEGGEASGSR